MPRTLAQNAQYIAETIKPAIKSAIEAQGVTVPSTDSFLDYADRIGEIEGGGSGYQLKDLPTGSISTVNDAAELPLNALKVSVEAVQDLHGYDHPWVGGAGDNLIDIERKTTRFFMSNPVFLAVGTYYVIRYASTRQINSTALYSATIDGTYNAVPESDNNDYAYCDRIMQWYVEKSIITIKQDCYIRFDCNTNDSGQLYSLMLTQNVSAYNAGTGAVDSDVYKANFKPYSNICPIHGWDSGEITVCDDVQNPTQTETITQQFPTTIYGAEWNVVSGLLSQTDGYIASYNGESLPSTWISDRDVYASGTTPTTGAEVVYKLATPTTIQLSPLSIRLFEGVNNVYADCGQVIDGEYFVDEGAHRYQLYDYIESDGTQVIDLGRQVMQGQTVKTVFHPMSNQIAYAWLLGSGDTSHYYGYQFPQQTTLLEYNGSTSSSGQMSVSTADEYVYNLAFTASNSLALNYYIFGINYSETPGGNNLGKFRLYSMSINGDDFLPCKRKSDGVFGLYDVANQAFLTDSAGGNAFVGGNPIGVGV